MKKIIWLIIACIPLPGIAQMELSGLWQVKEKQSFKGPDYENGIPKLMKIETTGNIMKIEATNSIGTKDTLEIETLNIDGTVSESTTLSRRHKTTRFTWDKNKAEWNKKTLLSSKTDPTKIEITILETFKLDNSTNSLTIIKDYDGADAIGGNQDYHMLGVYEKTTPERLSLETAVGNGVKFTDGFNWQQILDKARSEHKYIFVDCYATWCVPCKKMDKEVYSLNIIGEAMNKNFVCVKVQMDTTKNDNEAMKITYPIARSLEKEYNVQALPTYLFFDSLGNPVHKDVGEFNAKDFLKVISDAKDPSKQIYSLARTFEEGKLSYAEMAILALKLKDEKYLEKELASRIARNYFEGYLYKLPEQEFFKQQNLDFFLAFSNVIKSTDKLVESFVDNPKRIDSLSGQSEGFAKNIIKYVISRNEIQPELKKADTLNIPPDWSLIEKRIDKKFGKEYVSLTIVDAKVRWYQHKKQWKLFCDNLVKQVGMWGDLSKVHWLALNGTAWDIFEHSNNMQQLKKALGWSEVSIKNQLKDTTVKDAPWHGFLDTYANLLYKLGRKKEAIQYYKEKILDVVGEEYSEYNETYNKMKEGKPTWPQN